MTDKPSMNLSIIQRWHHYGWKPYDTQKNENMPITVTVPATLFFPLFSAIFLVMLFEVGRSRFYLMIVNFFSQYPARSHNHILKTAHQLNIG